MPWILPRHTGRFFSWGTRSLVFCNDIPWQGPHTRTVVHSLLTSSIHQTPQNDQPVLRIRHHSNALTPRKTLRHSPTEATRARSTGQLSLDKIATHHHGTTWYCLG